MNLLKLIHENTFKRLFFVLSLTFLLLNGHTIIAQNQKVKIKGDNLTVKEIFRQIESQSKLFVDYNTNDIDENKIWKIAPKGDNVKEVMGQVLSNTNKTFIVKNGHIIISQKSTNQSKKGVIRQVTGVVVDEEQLPIIGAHILVKTEGRGTVSDIDGNFKIDVKDNDILEVAFMGYLSQEVRIKKSQNHYNILLKEHTELLDEVVVVGYGTVKKGNLTTSVSNIKGDVLQNRPAQTVTDVLQGEVAGLNIVSSGKPGQAASIQLRGATSLNASGSPLILVDGIPGEFNFLNVNDIENITVLKDAASAAIYGSRAAHGVILVTTKRGNTGSPKFSYNGYVGVNTPTDMPKTVSSAEFARIRNESQVNIGRKPIYSAEDIAKYASGEDPNRYPNTDWIDLMFKNSISTRHSIAASGGTESVKYHLSAGFDHQNGVVPEISQQVFNVRSNVDVKLSKRFNLSFDMRYIQRKKEEVARLDGTVQDIYKMNPTLLAYYTDGSYGYNPFAIVNPIAYLHEFGNSKYDRHDASGILKLDYKIFDGLKFTGIANANYLFVKNKNQYKEMHFTEYFTQEQISVGQNSLSDRRDDNYYYNIQALLNYTKKFGEHSIDALIGYQQENQKSSWLYGSRDDYPTDLVGEIAGGSQENWKNDGNASHWAIASVIGRINYDYAGKYMLTANFRTDGSSRFSKGNRWSTFPSVAVAWRVTGEKFMRNTSHFLDDWKLRVSMGKTGASSGVGLYPSYTTIGIGKVILDNTYQQTAYLKSIGNTELGWETTNMVDIGTDIQLFGNRLSFVFDYYIKNTKDILIGLPTPLEYGFGNTKVNIGQVRNKGWEIELGWNDNIGEFNYNIKANLSNNKNEVKDLGGTGPWKGGYTEVGLPMNSLYGYQAMGYFQSEKEIEDAPFQNVKNKPGDIRYVDQNGDNKIDGDDRVVIGDRNPHYLYGLRLGGEYKNFDFSMFFQGVGKKDYIMSGPGIQPLTNGGTGPVFKHQTDYWTPDNTNAKYPRILDSTEGGFNYAVSDFWKINGGYLRMKNLQIGYKLPSKILAPVGLSYARIYFSASNLFTIDNFIPGYDPETNNAFTYPLARTFSFGLNVNF